MNFPKADRKRGRRTIYGKFTPERNAMIEWQGWLLDNNVPRSTQNEIAEAYPNMFDRLEYIETLCRHCHEETDVMKGRRVCRNSECNSMDC